ncbi:MAG TPA: hypothetical protein VKA18_02185 [Alphaproteobacteria bacterium]|nr:hypothetical protein [Alphaproteobacteria bacterium]
MVTFSLTLAAFTALSVVPHSTADLIEDQVDNLKTGFEAEGLTIDEACLRVTITDLLNHPNPDELKLKLDKIRTSAERLLPAMPHPRRLCCNTL